MANLSVLDCLLIIFVKDKESCQANVQNFLRYRDYDELDLQQRILFLFFALVMVPVFELMRHLPLNSLVTFLKQV